MSIKIEVGQVWKSGNSWLHKITAIVGNKAMSIDLLNDKITGSFTTVLPDGSGMGLDAWELLGPNVCIEDCCKGNL
jgi:hypothetical protein